MRGPIGTHYEEWRLAFELPESPHTTEGFIDRLRPQVHPDVEIHRKDKRGIRLYSTSRAHMESAVERVEERLAAWQFTAKLELARWNPGGQRWQDPSLPIDPVPAPLPDPWADIDELAWEVRLRFESDWEMLRILAELRDQGLPVLEGWNRCLIALPDEATARARADDLQQMTPRSKIEVRPLSRFRKWQIRQRVFGNYAKGADTGSPSSP